jgi:signal transduction histidine kinase
MTSPNGTKGTANRRFLALAFAFLALTAAMVGTISTMETGALEARSKAAIGSLTDRSRLLARIDHDIDRIWILVGEHVFEKGVEEMAALDEQISAAKLDLAASAGAYERLAKTPAQQIAWHRVWHEWTSIESGLDPLLALSRRNKDVEAHAAKLALTDRYGAVARDLEETVSADGQASAEEFAQVATDRLHLFVILFCVSVAQVVVVLLVARIALRLDRRHDLQRTRQLELVEQRNRDLDAFAGRVAHDIRGPLAIISLSVGRLVTQAPEAVGTIEIERLRRGIDRMESLIDDLLALASVGERTPATCDPATVAGSLVEDFAPRLECEYGSLQVTVDHANANGSEGLLRQALANLIDNALKYRRPDAAPQIEIVGGVEGDQYVLRVSDNGVGMSAKDASRAFEPLYRSSRTQDVRGTGLGLAIVRRVVEACGGRVMVAHSRIGSGTTFEIQLSVAHPMALGKEADAKKGGGGLPSRGQVFP